MGKIQEEQFIKFVCSLHEEHPKCFEYDHSTWTEKYAGEDGVFAVYVRTLIWNEKESERVFEKEFRGYDSARRHFLDKGATSFDNWVKEITDDIKFGADGKGAHRDNRHKKSIARALRDYFKLMDNSQIRFLKNANSFDELFSELKTIFSVKDLTAFDILERLYRSKHRFIEVYPLKYYGTGGGAERGLSMIYPRLKTKELEKKGTDLLHKIIPRAGINQEIAFFEIESILCICQKSPEEFQSLLDGESDPETLAESYANRYCPSETEKA